MMHGGCTFSGTVGCLFCPTFEKKKSVSCSCFQKSLADMKGRNQTTAWWCAFRPFSKWFCASFAAESTLVWDCTREAFVGIFLCLFPCWSGVKSVRRQLVGTLKRISATQSIFVISSLSFVLVPKMAHKGLAHSSENSISLCTMSWKARQFLEALFLRGYVDLRLCKLCVSSSLNSAVHLFILCFAVLELILISAWINEWNFHPLFVLCQTNFTNLDEGEETKFYCTNSKRVPRVLYSCFSFITTTPVHACCKQNVECSKRRRGVQHIDLCSIFSRSKDNGLQSKCAILHRHSQTRIYIYIIQSATLVSFHLWAK